MTGAATSDASPSQPEPRASAPTRAGPREAWWVGPLHVGALCGFALAQPLFEVLANDSVFFIAHRLEAMDVVLFALAAALGPPLLAAALVGLVSRAGRAAGRGLHLGMVAVLFAVVLMHTLHQKTTLLEGQGWWVVAAVLASGSLCSLAYTRLQALRFFLTVLSPAPLVFMAFFVFHPNVFKVIHRPAPEPVAGVQADVDTSVVMLILDELPATSLLDGSGHVDPVLLPNFARLAAGSTWFRNASASHEATAIVIPSILTGTNPDGDKLPIAHDHPRSLFTMLAGTHRFKVREEVTDICPADLNSTGKAGKPFLRRMRSLAKDLALVYAHVVLPDGLTGSLPSVTGNWGSFWRDFESPWQRTRIFEEFIASIDASPEPTLYFLHVLLPHLPWLTLPSGRGYATPDANRDPHEWKRWANDERVTHAAYQRYLLQLGHVDGLLGKLLDRLEETGVYDRSLLVVMADHGMSFDPGERRRRPTKKNYQDILFAPLFVKQPFQREGRESDRNAESVDVLPTVADVLGIQLSWELDGRSLLDETLPDRKKKRIRRLAGGPMVFPSLQEGTWPGLGRRERLFGPHPSWDDVFAMGPRPDLQGRGVDDIGRAPPIPGEARLEGSGRFPLVSAAGVVPSLVSGTLHLDDDRRLPLTIAVTVNDVVGAVGTVPASGEGAARFDLMVSDALFVDGRNELRVHAVLGTGPATRLAPIDVLSYRFEQLGGGPARIVGSDGSVFGVLPGAVTGHLDRVEKGPDMVRLGGWAVDVSEEQPTHTVLVFSGDECVFFGATAGERPDVAAMFEQQTSGFELEVPTSLFGEMLPGQTRLFVVSGDVASEVDYSPEAAWVSTVRYRLAPGDPTAILGNDGTRRPIVSKGFDGVVDAAVLDDEVLVLVGWAAHRAGRSPAHTIAVLTDDGPVHSARPDRQRPDVQAAMGLEGAAPSGFLFSLPLESLPGRYRGRVRLFALVEDAAFELRWGPRAEWLRDPALPVHRAAREAERASPPPAADG